MIIKTIDDWVKLAQSINDELKIYADTFGIDFDEQKTKIALETGDLSMLRNLSNTYQRIWAELPDLPEIRYGPFFDLCDLCSENWVLFETE